MSRKSFVHCIFDESASLGVVRMRTPVVDTLAASLSKGAIVLMAIRGLRFSVLLLAELRLGCLAFCGSGSVEVGVGVSPSPFPFVRRGAPPSGRHGARADAGAIRCAGEPTWMRVQPCVH